jgi:hypothetical protein
MVVEVTPRRIGVPGTVGDSSSGVMDVGKVIGALVGDSIVESIGAAVDVTGEAVGAKSGMSLLENAELGAVEGAIVVASLMNVGSSVASKGILEGVADGDSVVATKAVGVFVGDKVVGAGVGAIVALS